jgi:hypothetical protein
MAFPITSAKKKPGRPSFTDRLGNAEKQGVLPRDPTSASAALPASGSSVDLAGLTGALLPGSKPRSLFPADPFSAQTSAGLQAPAEPSPLPGGPDTAPSPSHSSHQEPAGPHSDLAEPGELTLLPGGIPAERMGFWYGDENCANCAYYEAEENSCRISPSLTIQDPQTNGCLVGYTARGASAEAAEPAGEERVEQVEEGIPA